MWKKASSTSRLFGRLGAAALLLCLFLAVFACGDSCPNQRGFGPSDCGGGTTDGGTTTGGSGQLYVTQGNSILRFSGATTIEGDVAPAAVIEGTDTRLSTPGYLFLDTGNDRLYVANTGANNILVFDKISTRTGTGNNIPPDRILEGGNTTLAGPTHAVVDLTRDVLYVLNRASLLAFSNASTVQGDVAPLRTIEGSNTSFSSPSMLRLDTGNDRMYVANTAASSILVFEAISTTLGNPFPNRILRGPNTRLGEPSALEIDGSDNLFVANPTQLLRFNPASTVTEDTAPLAVIEGGNTGLSRAGQVVLDSSGNLFVANTGGNQILVFDGIASANGNPFPNRRVEGANTRLSGPRGIALDPSR